MAYALGQNADTLFDPAVGTGALLRAAKAYGERRGKGVVLAGVEIDADALRQARHDMSADDLARVEVADFLRYPSTHRCAAIVANPPYIRHHRLSAEVKTNLRQLAIDTIGRPLDGRTGLHVYFLVKALGMLEDGGRLAFIVPADTCEGVASGVLWEWIAGRFSLDAVVTFTPAAAPFPGVDTNALVLLISRNAPCATFKWAICSEWGTSELAAWIECGLPLTSSPGLAVCERDLAEGLATGLSRPPQASADEGVTLGAYARTMRGIVTGANDFFLLTARRVAELNLPPSALALAIGRTRDVVGNELTAASMEALAAAERPTHLLYLDGRPVEELPPPVQDYLRTGVALGLPQRTILASRRPWYRMETRAVPPILFAYLGRRNTRFILNTAGALPLTGFLCVYPRSNDPAFVAALWGVLNRADTLANLPYVGKTYGDWAIKVEPRALEQLKLPADIVAKVRLRSLLDKAEGDAGEESTGCSSIMGIQ